MMAGLLHATAVQLWPACHDQIQKRLVERHNESQPADMGVVSIRYRSMGISSRSLYIPRYT